MKKIIILIAAMTMTTLTLQANETIDTMTKAVTDVVQGTSSEAEAAKNAEQADEKNETKSEEKTPTLR